MKFEQPSMPSPEEMAKTEKERTLSDAELLKEGAEYKFNEGGEKSLNVTDEQVEAAREEMERSKALEKEQKMSELRKGLDLSSVWVKRSSGKMESGWTVLQIDFESGSAQLTGLDEDGSTINKKVPLENLEQWNRVAEKKQLRERLETAGDLYDVVSIIKESGDIQGSDRSYTSEELIKIIEDVYLRDGDIGRLTNAGGLRQKVGELLSKSRRNTS
jgi:hypothetical protein